MRQHTWFDGHLDLACLAIEGRDLSRPLSEVTGGPHPSGVSFPSLQDGQVTHCMGTIFTAAGFQQAFGYPRHDIEAAHQAGLAQLQQYQQWEWARHIQIVKEPDDLYPSVYADAEHTPLKVLLLMEGADPIRSPQECQWWFEQGLRVVGLSWAMGSQYAGGNYAKGPLTQQGIACLQALDTLGVIHDLSHLSEQAFWDVLSHTKGPVIASHSNCQSLVESGQERHLTDAQISAIGQRDGVIGINLLSRFLIPPTQKRRASIEETIAHIEHICEIMGRNDRIALGSDMDGGFNTTELPEHINAPKDYPALQEGLRARGWSDQDLTGFARRNWLDFFHKHLPSSTRD